MAEFGIRAALAVEDGGAALGRALEEEVEDALDIWHGARSRVKRECPGHDAAERGGLVGLRPVYSKVIWGPVSMLAAAIEVPIPGGTSLLRHRERFFKPV